MAYHKVNFDSLLELKDAGLVASSAAAQVDGADKILDLGQSFWEGNIVVDIAACEVATGDEKYEIEFQLSPDATFGTAGNIRINGVLKLGDSSVNNSGADTAATGRYVLCVHNEFAGTLYRYARLFTRISGAIATGINYAAWATAE